MFQNNEFYKVLRGAANSENLQVIKQKNAPPVESNRENASHSELQVSGQTGQVVVRVAPLPHHDIRDLFTEPLAMTPEEHVPQSGMVIEKLRQTAGCFQFTQDVLFQQPAVSFRHSGTIKFPGYERPGCKLSA